MAPPAGAPAQGAGQAHGVPRDHEGCDPPGGRQHPRPRHRPRRRPGNPPYPRPPLRLRDFSRALAQGGPRALRRTRAVRRDPTRRRARTRTPGVRVSQLLGPDRPARPGRSRRRLRIPGQARAPGRRAHRHRQRLRRLRQAQARREGGDPRRGIRPRPHRGPQAAERSGHRHEGGLQAVPPQPRRTVHHLDPAAGSGPQAPLHRPADHERRPVALRKRLHHLHANRLPVAVAAGAHRSPHPGIRSLRPGNRAGPAPPVQGQEQERAGGARGDPPLGRHLPHPGVALLDAPRQRLQALRPDLEAHRRLADGGCDGLDRVGHHRGRPHRPLHASVGLRRARRVLGQRHRHHLPRFHARLRGRARRGAQRAHRPDRVEASAAGRGPGAEPRRGRGQGARNHPGRPVHRGQPGQEARGARHRPPLDLRVDHLHDHGAWLRHAPRSVARSELDRLLGGAPARGLLRRPRRIRLHRRNGGRPRPHRRRQSGPGRLADQLLLRFRQAPRASPGHRQPR